MKLLLTLSILLLTAIPQACADMMFPIAISKKVKNVVTVAKSGGNFTSVQQAMDSINDASESNQYVIYIAPGRYELTKRLVIDNYVHLVGSGEGATELYGFVVNATLSAAALIVSNRTTSLQFLKVANYASTNANKSVGIYGEPFLKHVSVKMASRSAQSYGVYVIGHSDLQDVSVEMEDTSDYHNHYGIYLDNAYALVKIYNSKITIQGAGMHYGIYAEGSSPMISDVHITCSGMISNGSPTHSYGIYSTDNSAPQIYNSTIVAEDATAFSEGIVALNGSTPKLRRSNVTVSGEGTNHVLRSDGGTITAAQSTLEGTVLSGAAYLCLQCDNGIAELNTACNVL